MEHSRPIGRIGRIPWASSPETYPLSIAALIANGTMDANIAATLWAAVDEQRSFITVAVPQRAGKTTVASAVLGLRRPDIPLHFLTGDPAQLSELAREPASGYLVVAEFSQGPVPGYIWGAPVRRVFETLRSGYALQTSLHAPGVRAAIDVLTTGNAIPDGDASNVDLIVYIEVFRSEAGETIRRVSEVYELFNVEGGEPRGQTLFRWDSARDAFETLAPPRQFGRDAAGLEQRSAMLRELVATGRLAIGAVEEAVASYRSAGSHSSP